MEVSFNSSPDIPLLSGLALTANHLGSNKDLAS
jgi:hypothetical protein